MPANFEIPDEEMERFEANVKRFEEFLENLPDDVTLFDLDNFEIVMYVRLRSVLTTDQLHHRAHVLIQKAEEVLHTPGAFTDSDGLEVQPILAENFEDTEDLHAAMKQLARGFSDEDLEMLLNAEGEEE